MKILVLFFFALSANAETLTAIPGRNDYSKVPELEAIMAQLKPYGDFSEKVESTPDTQPLPKTLSKGELAVEQAKARNRAILAEQARNDKAEVKPGEADGPEKWRADTQKVQAGWKKEIQDQLRQWQLEQKVFEGKVKIYQENTFKIPVKEEKIVEKKINLSTLPDVHIVSGAFDVPVRDQNNRPTCSAFAGIRAVEILLAQNKKKADLSEQYFYWASKPNCQKGPCTEKGSWITNGYRHSQNQKIFDIPEESFCSYKVTSDPQNETQIPLTETCKEGMVKVESYEEVRTLAEAIEKLKKNYPVVLAAKLSGNFYRNQGLITLKDSQKKSPMDGHSLGHAFLAVGIIELPVKLQATEGAYCLVVVNSWGKGWGAGGYSCLTQNWLEKFRQPSPFVAPLKLSIK